ncbi:MAG: TetR/AcrR family transcriptional regulator [Paracoccaceae bacterium]|nr:TetR/AcrR family transcriptional regulator [Paracoccaceae bacterium]
MARTAGSHSQTTGPRVKAAALKLFARRGYASVSMREIAMEVGVQAGALYSYTPNKQSLLFSLMHDHLTDLLAEWSGYACGPAPRDRLMGFVRCHLEYHLPRGDEVFIAYMELRNLSDDNFGQIENMRKRYEDALGDIILAGVKTGDFAVADNKIATLAIIGLLKEVSTWYRPDGRLEEVDLIELYQTMACGVVGAQVASSGLPPV